jgi:hypothetical protein
LTRDGYGLVPPSLGRNKGFVPDIS